MSRSYRKQPFFNVCVCYSSAWDKKQASRSLRRVINHDIRKILKSEELDEFLIKKRDSYPHGNVYTWKGDGRKRYNSSTDRNTEIRPIIYIDEITQVERVMDGEKAISDYPYSCKCLEEFDLDNNPDFYLCTCHTKWIERAMRK